MANNMIQKLLTNILGNQQAMQNPIMKNAMNLMQNGNISGIKELAENLAKEHGTTVEEVRKKLGI